MNKLRIWQNRLLPIWKPGDFPYISHGQYISQLSQSVFWDQSWQSEQLVKAEPRRFWNGADGKTACVELALAITTHQSQTPASECKKNIQPWNLLRFRCALGYSNNMLTRVTRFDAHTILQAVLTHTCATKMFVSCSVLGNEAHALQMHQWAQIAAAGLLSRKRHQGMCFLPWKDPFWGYFQTIRQVVSAVLNLPLFLCFFSGLLRWPQAGEQASGNYYLMQLKWLLTSTQPLWSPEFLHFPCQ